MAVHSASYISSGQTWASSSSLSWPRSNPSRMMGSAPASHNTPSVFAIRSRSPGPGCFAPTLPTRSKRTRPTTTSASAWSCEGSSERRRMRLWFERGQTMRGHVMSSRCLFVGVPVACLMAVSLFGIAPVANAEGVGRSAKAEKIASANVLYPRHRSKRRFRSVKIHLPLGPSSVYYDYPYYYARGHYPTHIGGYVYYPYHIFLFYTSC